MEEFKEKDDKVSQVKHQGDETSFIQEKNFMLGSDNYPARIEPSIETKQMSNPEVGCEPHHRNTLKFSEEFSGKYNKSSASTSRPAKVVSSMDFTRNKNRKLESHWGGMVSSSINGAAKMEKGKESIIYESDDSRSSSNRRKNGLENFECIGSRGVVSTVKRQRIHESESEKLVGGKRLKGSENGNFSFMNWVSSITNGLSRPQDGHMEGPPCSISEEVRESIGVSHGNRGFRSIFHAVYRPENSLSCDKIKNIDHQKEKDTLKGNEGVKSSNFACSVLPERSNFCADSSFSFDDGEKENISATPLTLCAYGIAPPGNDIEIHDKVLALSKRFNEDVCPVKSSPSSAMDYHAELMAQSRQAFQNSLWIIRLSHGVSSSPQLKSIEFSNCLDLLAQHKLPYLEAKKIRFCEKPQHNSVFHTDSDGSVRIVTQNHKSNIQLTISSKYCKTSKPMNSSFSQRFDALKLTKSSKISDENMGTNKICVFCGMNDHIIRECSEVVETKLELYLKSISLYGSINKESCLCILCFQLDHWASSCTNGSSRGSHISLRANGFSDVKLNSTEKKKHENPSFCDYDGAIMLRSECKKFHHEVLHGNTLSQNENEAIETDIVVDEEDRSEKNESSGCGTIDLLIYQAEDTTNTNKMKMPSSCPAENELKKSEFKSFCSRLPTTVTDKPEGIFVAVRKLRLSRLDVLRWMKSRAPHYNLDGFFLRLRIGKLEKGLESTGYHVACINGASCQSSISVCVGSSTYLVTCPFISNHDFNEDELMAWWFQNLRDGTKMPSTEELNDKFLQRLKFGF